MMKLLKIIHVNVKLDCLQYIFHPAEKKLYGINAIKFVEYVD